VAAVMPIQVYQASTFRDLDIKYNDTWVMLTQMLKATLVGCGIFLTSYIYASLIAGAVINLALFLLTYHMRPCCIWMINQTKLCVYLAGAWSYVGAIAIKFLKEQLSKEVDCFSDSMCYTFIPMIAVGSGWLLILIYLIVFVCRGHIDILRSAELPGMNGLSGGLYFWATPRDPSGNTARVFPAPQDSPGSPHEGQIGHSTPDTPLANQPAHMPPPED